MQHFHRFTRLICLYIPLTWLCGVLCESQPSRIDHRDADSGVTHSSVHHYLNFRKVLAGYPDWDDDLTFSFEQFPGQNEVNQAKRAMLGVIDMLQTTMAVMYPDVIEIKQPWPAPQTNPSFQRYFFTDNLPQVAEVFKRLLAALGAPGFKGLLECYQDELLTLKVVYGDYSGSKKPALCHDEPTLSAYAQYEEDERHPDGVFAVISLCQPFFDRYRDYLTVHMGLFGAPSIDQGTVANTYELPCYTSSLTLLHELLHWGALGSDVLGYVITDQVVYDPAHQDWTVAYRPFFSMKMLDSTYNTNQWTPLSNVDNYVFAVQEIYWKIRTQRRNWWADPVQGVAWWPADRPPPGGE